MKDPEKEIARLVLAMSEEDRRVFAAGLNSNLQGYYFEDLTDGIPLEDEHVFKAITDWAQDELRLGG